tara:strand:+ start:1341 stop:1529 length:189 start_codon:yes stop_codon:yes gene_type:complete
MITEEEEKEKEKEEEEEEEEEEEDKLRILGMTYVVGNGSLAMCSKRTSLCREDPLLYLSRSC